MSTPKDCRIIEKCQSLHFLNNISKNHNDGDGGSGDDDHHDVDVDYADVDDDVDSGARDRLGGGRCWRQNRFHSRDLCCSRYMVMVIYDDDHHHLIIIIIIIMIMLLIEMNKMIEVLEAEPPHTQGLSTVYENQHMMML